MPLQQRAAWAPCWAAAPCRASPCRPPQQPQPALACGRQRQRRQRRALAARAGELPVVDWQRSQVQQCLFIDRCVQGRAPACRRGSSRPVELCSGGGAACRRCNAPPALHPAPWLPRSTDTVRARFAAGMLERIVSWRGCSRIIVGYSCGVEAAPGSRLEWSTQVRPPLAGSCAGAMRRAQAQAGGPAHAVRCHFSVMKRPLPCGWFQVPALLPPQAALFGVAAGWQLRPHLFTAAKQQFEPDDVDK